MFKKTWKQIKILVILVIVLICLPHSILPHKTEKQGTNSFELYNNLNEAEKRMIEFKDDTETLKLKTKQLDLINQSRKEQGAQPLQLDILASRVANKMSKEAAENGYLGHWNMEGEKPYHRYGLAGGYDHVSENAFGEWTTGTFQQSTTFAASMMKKGHLKFMAEKAPDNGHKINISDKSHNFIGIGYYLNDKQFRYYEEYIDRYYEFENIPQVVSPGQQFTITVKTTDRRFLFFLIAYRDEKLEPLTPEQISKKGNYPDFSDEQYLNMPPWQLARFRNGTIYQIPLTFNDKGLYYIQIYSDKNEITKSSSVTTKGKTPESGIVIKVE